MEIRTTCILVSIGGADRYRQQSSLVKYPGAFTLVHCFTTEAVMKRGESIEKAPGKAMQLAEQEP
jgi:hypothetical protein